MATRQQVELVDRHTPIDAPESTKSKIKGAIDKL